MAASDGFGMPFRRIVRSEDIDEVLDLCGVEFRRRVYDPHTLIWAWMGQALSQDRSCRHAVSQVVAYNAAHGRAVSARTGAYVQARDRLDVQVLQDLARGLARRLEDGHGLTMPIARPLIACDGTTLSGPDTPSIVLKYPKLRVEYGDEGLGFPTMRALILTSLATGAVMDIQLAPYRGKGTHEIPLLKRSLLRLRKGDIVVGDRAYCSKMLLSYLPQRGIDLVARRLDDLRLGDLRVVTIHGKRDHVYEMRRPRPQQMPNWLSATEIQSSPARFPIRVTSTGANIRGRRRELSVVTTLVGKGVRKQSIEDVYRLRWDIETDIRTLKSDLGSGILRCQSAAMIEKEIWMTVLAYNAVRALIAQAAERVGCLPRELSFKGATQAINAFGPRMSRAAGEDRQRLYDQMLESIASHEVRNRPGRVEPRATKRRNPGVVWLTESRAKARLRGRRGCRQ